MNLTKENIIAAIKTVFDPEIPVNVWDLGLIYDIEIREPKAESRSDESNSVLGSRFSVLVKMTMTSPTCPMAEELLDMVRMAAESIAGAGNVTVDLVWDPPWDINRMSSAARLELDLTEEGW